MIDTMILNNLGDASGDSFKTPIFKDIIDTIINIIILLELFKITDILNGFSHPEGDKGAEGRVTHSPSEKSRFTLNLLCFKQLFWNHLIFDCHHNY